MDISDIGRLRRCRLRRFYKIFIVLALFLLLFIGWVVFGVERAESPVEANYMRLEALQIISGNSLIGTRMPYIPEIFTMGFVVDLEILMLLEQYDWDAMEALVILECESGVNRFAVGDKDTAYHSFGLFQIRNLPSRNYTLEELFDPERNIEIAYKMWKERGWKLDWVNCSKLLNN